MTGQHRKNTIVNPQKNPSQNTQSKLLEHSCENMHVNRHVNENAYPSAIVSVLMQVPPPETRSMTHTFTGSLVAFMKLNGNWKSDALQLPCRDFINILGGLILAPSTHPSGTLVRYGRSQRPNHNGEGRVRSNE